MTIEERGSRDNSTLRKKLQASQPYYPLTLSKRNICRFDSFWLGLLFCSWQLWVGIYDGNRRKGKFPCIFIHIIPFMEKLQASQPYYPLTLSKRNICRFDSFMVRPAFLFIAILQTLGQTGKLSILIWFIFQSVLSCNYAITLNYDIANRGGGFDYLPYKYEPVS